MTDPGARDQVARLEAEIERLQRVNEVLMNRVERSTDAAGSSYSLFETNLLLQSKVARQVSKLTDVNRALQEEIASHQRTEEELRWERNFVDAVLEAASALILVLDAQGRIVRFNRTCERVSGYTADDIRTTSLSRLIPASEVGKVEETFQALLARRGGERAENHWVSRAGELRLISWSNSTIVGDDGEVEYVVSLGIDITEARAAQRQLELYQRIFLASRDAILITDPNGFVTQANPAYVELRGVSEDQIRGTHARDVTTQGDGLSAALMRDGAYKGESGIRTVNDEERTVDLSVFPIEDDEHNRIHWVGMARDITDLKRALDALEKKNRELRDAQASLVQTEKMAALGKLVAGIAHEINTPVGSIASMHDSLVRAIAKLEQCVHRNPPTDDADRAKVERMLSVIADANRVIHTGTDRVTAIVRRLRSFARLDEAELKRADIHEGIDDTLSLLHHELRHEVNVVRRYGALPSVPHFVGRLNQVFLNLLVNARQAISGPGTITISTELADGMVSVSIHDTGCGIPEEHLDQIFDPGFTTKGVGVGTGLGLSICYQIVEAHRGTLSVASEVGRGTTFTLRFPANLDELLGVS